MRISSLNLRDFRNYRDACFAPREGLNIVVGKNAQGKTSLLEAVFLCAFGRSHRSPRDAEMVRRSCVDAFVDLRFVQGFDVSRHIFVGLDASPKKRVLLDGEPIGKIGDLVGELAVLMFSPESLELVKGSASERRRFLNMEISQLGGNYFFVLQQYNAVLKQRNALLKSPSARNVSYMRVWDSGLAKAGVLIAKARALFVSRLAPLAEDVFESISLGRDSLEIKYVTQLEYEGLSDNEIAEGFQRLLADGLEEDIRRGHTRCGVHKDDLMLKINGLDARTFASQGQQRTLSLALKLSEIELIRQIRGDLPVILLDDVFSELDELRCKSLLDYIGRCQCIITCANPAAIERVSDNAALFVCDSGMLTQIDKI